MNQTQDDRLARSVKSSDLEASTVAAYLRANPDFFVTHPELLTELLLPHESGDAISLVEHQVSVLRDRNIESRKHLGSLLEAAKINDALFGKTRELVLALLDAPDLIELVSTLKAQLRADFDVTAITVFALDGTLTPVLGIQSTTRANAEDRLGNLLHGSAACGAIREQEGKFLFPENSGIRSAAVVPLRHHGFRGILALGSVDAHRFDPRMGTLFLRYIGEVLSRLLTGSGQKVTAQGT
jgi:uncharacterized protein YigA (DUF484 family)